MRLRKVFGVLLVAIVAAIGLTAAIASANDEVSSGNAEPQTTNIPYIGWIGSQIRLTKCVPLNNRQMADAEAKDATLSSRLNGNFEPFPWPFYTGNFALEGWSGTNTSIVDSPYFNNATGARTTGDVVPWFERYRGPDVNVVVGHDAKGDPIYDRVRPGNEGVRLCFSAHITSPSSGLGPVKLAIRDDFLGLFPGVDPEHKHLFLVIFLKPVQPTLTEETVLNGQPLPVGDPDGSTFTPDYFNQYGFVDPAVTKKTWGKGLAKVVVKGTFPYGALPEQFPQGPGGLVTLPDQYGSLATLWATDDSTGGGYFGSAPQRWDIHDDTLLTEGHSSNACSTGASIDAVDNCLGNLSTDASDADYGPFSRDNTNHSFPLYSNLEVAYPAVGPFDQLRPNSSFLPDGSTPNAGDAPMPALRVDFNLSATSVGALIKADKSVVYSRDRKGTATAHNLYAPFYKAYIPAAPGYEGGRSGVAGAVGNNYPAYLTDRGSYDYWDLLDTLDRQEVPNNCQDPSGTRYPGIYLLHHATVYTDEHGEAWIGYDPVPGDNDGLGNFNLSEATNGVNSICDVAPGTAATTTISAVAKLPDQPGAAWTADKSLVKVIKHLGSKTLSCVAKTPKPQFPGATCTETILDLAGNPIANAKVQFSVEALGSSGASVRDDQGGNPTPGTTVTLYTKSDGTAKVYVDNSFNSCVNVTAENLGTRYNELGVGVTRDAWIKPRNTGGVEYTDTACTILKGTSEPAGTTGGTTTGGTTTGGTTTGGTTTGGSSSGSSNSGSSSAAGSAVTVSLGGPVIQAQPVLQVSTTPKIVSSNQTKLFSVKVLQTKLGRYLVVNVKGTAKTAKVRIAIMGRNGKVLRTIVRTVPTNKAFKIANFKLAKTAVSVKASVIA